MYRNYDKLEEKEAHYKKKKDAAMAYGCDPNFDGAALTDSLSYTN
ncbi:12969_t:CDS:2 [Cetraspora pellucida]|uniref:12969_t:CDS:1 n=1 Tax=Cetraspora pellucida TaxID=1433469 RepID=A0A9N9HAD8_9GLOM|nr:12969_t:CDS:2 [Cetraspora pellucida]